MAVQIQLRRDSAADWTDENPTLAEGEVGYETDTGKAKVGDGSLAWADLPYRFEGGGGGGGSVDSVNGQTGTVVITAASISAQPADADLTAIAALTGTGAWLKRTGANTWSLSTPTASDVGALTQTSGDARYSQLGHTHPATDISDGTSAGRALLTAADAAAQRTALGLGTLATQSGTFSGTSSGTNTGDQTITLTGAVTGAGTGTFATSQVVQSSLYYATPANGTLVITAKAAYGFTINELRGVKTSAGSLTVAVKINGTNVTGLSAVSVTTSAQDVSATAANTVAAGDRITVVISGSSSPADLEFTLKGTR